jgi:hypothetical protein
VGRCRVPATVRTSLDPQCLLPPQGLQGRCLRGEGAQRGEGGGGNTATRRSGERGMEPALSNSRDMICMDAQRSSV